MFRRKARLSETDRLFVLAGEQRGVAIDVSDEEALIGAGPECDYILLENEAGDACVALRRDEDDRLLASLRSGRAWLGGRMLRSGKALAAREGDVLTLGEVRLAAGPSRAAAADAVARSESLGRGLTWAAAAVVGLCGAGLVAFHGGGGDGGSGAPEPIRMASAGADTRSAYASAIAQQALSEHLEQIGLNGLEVVRDSDNGALHVAGALKESERARWREARLWFDASYGDSVPMDVKIEAAPEEIVLPFAIRAIWMTPRPRVVLHDGGRRGVGDALPGGWTVESIEAGSVAIIRGSERLVLTL